jgi:predicted RNA-binding Zn-ribbon protein involved in translation (DUF1610 family)
MSDDTPKTSRWHGSGYSAVVTDRPCPRCGKTLGASSVQFDDHGVALVCDGCGRDDWRVEFTR